MKFTRARGIVGRRCEPLLSSLPSRCAHRHVWHPGSLEWIQSTERSYADLLRSLARSRRIKRPSTDLAIPGPRLLICPCELHTHRADGATHVYCVVHLDGRCVVLRFLSMPKRRGTAKTEKASAARRQMTTGGGAEETNDPCGCTGAHSSRTTHAAFPREAAPLVAPLAGARVVAPRLPWMTAAGDQVSGCCCGADPLLRALVCRRGHRAAGPAPASAAGFATATSSGRQPRERAAPWAL